MRRESSSGRLGSGFGVRNPALCHIRGEDLVHNFCLVGQVVFGIADAVSHVGLEGDGHFDPCDAHGVGKSDLFPLGSGSVYGFLRLGVPSDFGEPYSQGVPSVVRDGVRFLVVTEVDTRLIEFVWVNVRRVVDDRNAARSKLRIFVCP